MCVSDPELRQYGFKGRRERVSGSQGLSTRQDQPAGTTYSLPGISAMALVLARLEAVRKQLGTIGPPPGRAVAVGSGVVYCKYSGSVFGIQ